MFSVCIAEAHITVSNTKILF